MSILWGIVAYLIGAFPSAQLWTKISIGEDITRLGSKNPGALNTLRNAGTIPGILTLISDMLKGFLAVLPPLILGLPYEYLFVFGILAAIGHNWPIFMKFKGGKGFASTVGSLVAISLSALFILLCVIIIFLFLFNKNASKAVAFGVWILPISTTVLFESSSILLVSLVWAMVLFIKYFPDIKKFPG
ncbi:glycerol-3-phosphate acyltransferase [Natranaerobius thermophilus]|uniref:Glycerol-3-phosphate acyltransferase n=1 Tax=Natranaerobius thermophilus (strain ATCC BAA-1301 / DSM 18059 / JW/NM-WN-LF) TaxID=457570 RepID=B2A783_NATTJ|nr:glycerol-3-phosphate acyltransferase [Natranaerobius thermophilus]ACB84277.1 protein of unknown function DUF205 [Natranaerobius thermophilus JW/NM-WN-LF]